jgi:hypothetical protein
LVLFSTWLISGLAAIVILAYLVRKPNASRLKRWAFAGVAVNLAVIWFIDFRLPQYLMRCLADGRLSLADFNTNLVTVKFGVNVLFGIAAGVFAFETGRSKSTHAERSAAADRPPD